MEYLHSVRPYLLACIDAGGILSCRGLSGPRCCVAHPKSPQFVGLGFRGRDSGIYQPALQQLFGRQIRVAFDLSKKTEIVPRKQDVCASITQYQMVLGRLNLECGTWGGTLFSKYSFGERRLGSLQGYSHIWQNMHH